jgi:hypothetical protein
MRHLLLSSFAALWCLGFFGLPRTSAALGADPPGEPNFSGNWILDLKASSSLDPLMTQIGATLLERKYVASTRLKAGLNQTDRVLTVATRGPAFALDETLHLDGRTELSNLKLPGSDHPPDQGRLVQGPQTPRRDLSDQNQTRKRGPTGPHKVPDRRRKNPGGRLQSEAQRRAKPTLCPPNLAQTSLSNRTLICSKI